MKNSRSLYKRPPLYASTHRMIRQCDYLLPAMGHCISVSRYMCTAGCCTSRVMPDSILILLIHSNKINNDV